MAYKNIELFSIEFDDFLPTYRTQPTLSGVVNVHLKDSISLTGIYIHLQGKAKICWTTKADNIYQTMDLLDFKFSLPATEGIVKLGPGEFTYPFSVKLPLDLPSSLEGEYGRVRYTCYAHIARPWRPDPKCKTCFTVLEMIDLNKIPHMESPLTMSQSNTIPEGCINATPQISGTMTLKKQGYVPGEHICIQADVDNQTSHNVRRVTISLICVFHYKSKNSDSEISQLNEKRSITRVKLDQIAPGNSAHWADIALLVPPIPPSRPDAYCPIIHIEYFVQLRADFSRTKNAGLEINMPIIIGSIPLISDFSTFQPPAAQTSPTTSATDVLGPSDLESAPPYSSSLFADYPDLPPPSYEQCVYEPVSLRDENQMNTQGNTNYTPRYMYFNQEYFPAPSSSGAQSGKGLTQS